MEMLLFGGIMVCSPPFKLEVSELFSTLHFSGMMSLPRSRKNGFWEISFRDHQSIRHATRYWTDCHLHFLLIKRSRSWKTRLGVTEKMVGCDHASSMIGIERGHPGTSSAAGTPFGQSGFLLDSDGVLLRPLPCLNRAFRGRDSQV